MGTILKITDGSEKTIYGYETVRDIHDIYDVIIKYMGYETKEWLEDYIKNIRRENEYLQMQVEDLEKWNI